MEERFIVVRVSRLGLANRLRTLADWYNIAVTQNRTLVVNWIPAVDCNVMLTDLFESEPMEKFESAMYFYICIYNIYMLCTYE